MKKVFKHNRRRRCQMRRAHMRWWCKKRDEFAALGLNSRGQPPKKRAFVPEIVHLHGRRRKTAWQRLARAKMRERGLSIRGNPLPNLPSRLEMAWGGLRATMPQSRASLDLTPLERGEVL